MRPDSRYISADSVFAAGHQYDEGGQRVIRSGEAAPAVKSRETLYRLQVLPLPEPPEDTYMVKVTDSFPLLAKQLLNDSEQWWVLAEANPQIRHPLDLAAADVVFIPS